MATPRDEAVRHLLRAVLPRHEVGLTDGQLLGRFVEQRDEGAFAALVRRHGPMVWGVCRRVLGSHHDAEDAFQAAFLVLARRAASVVPRENVGNWLYGVAQQTARKARATRAKRRAREARLTDGPEAEAPRQDAWADLRPVLDQELSLLPNKYRVAIVLCYLEGKTRQEAGRQLGLPEGTLAGWLARGKALLARRLARRGLALSGGALAAVLAREAAPAGVPPSVVSPTIEAATRLAAGQAAAEVVPAKVAALTDGVLKAMMLSKLKVALGVALVAVACVGAGLLTHRALATTPKETAVAGRPGEGAKGGTGKDERPADAPKAPKGAKPKGEDPRAKRLAEQELQRDRKSIQGTWSSVSGINPRTGEPTILPEGDPFHTRVTFGEKELRCSRRGKKGDYSEEFRKPLPYKLAAAAGYRKPIDLGPDANGDTFLGIYQLEEDRLILCVDLTPGSASLRPREFKHGGDNTLLLVLLKKR
jgi:RNA polymerase sigma factor (sigma-70 family)